MHQIEFATHPIQQVLVFLVGGIADRFQEIVVTRDTPAVLRRPLKFAAYAERTGNSWFGRQHFLHNDRIAPSCLPSRRCTWPSLRLYREPCRGAWCVRCRWGPAPSAGRWDQVSRTASGRYGTHAYGNRPSPSPLAARRATRPTSDPPAPAAGARSAASYSEGSP